MSLLRRVSVILCQYLVQRYEIITPFPNTGIDRRLSRSIIISVALQHCSWLELVCLSVNVREQKALILFKTIGLLLLCVYSAITHRQNQQAYAKFYTSRFPKFTMSGTTIKQETYSYSKTVILFLK